MSGFEAFNLRGNLVELAVAFILGVAFAAVVTIFTHMLMGSSGKVGGQSDFSSADGDVALLKEIRGALVSRGGAV